MKELYRGFTIKYSDKWGNFNATLKGKPQFSNSSLCELKIEIDNYLKKWQPETVRLFDKDNFTHDWFQWQFCDGLFKGMDSDGETMNIEVTFYDGAKGHRNNFGELVLKDTTKNRVIEKQILELHEKQLKVNKEQEKAMTALFDKLERFKPQSGEKKKKPKKVGDSI
jgi:hypothetical protein